MSCQISDIAHVSIVDIVQTKLGLLGASTSANNEGHDTEDNWDWDWQESAKSSPPSPRDPAWLQKCYTSLSPTGKVLVIAHQKQIVILNAYLDSREQSRESRTEYNVVSYGNICDSGEEITAVLCVPLISQLKSSPSGTDWTCIIVGFSSGYVRFFTEDKKLLLGEKLHQEPVTHIKCQSFRRASHSAAPEQPEELYIVYPSAVVTLPGFSLFQTLRACRNQLARVQASGSGSIEAPPLAHTKWGFSEQDVVKDCQVVGSASVNTYDHLMTASLCGGFDAVAKSSAPAHSLVVATGRKPYVGYHYTFEGNSQPILLGVARAMANTIKSSQGLMAITSFFTGSKPAQEKKNISTIEPAEPMGCRFGLCDLWRQGDAIVMSPSRTLSAVCDSLGRVILLDNLKGTALRMWKGYRDAQCGWIEVKEPASRTSTGTSSRSNKHRPKVALFLAIYSPKKGIIEIWAMQQGPKVASFSVSKGGRLLYTNYGHVGVNNVAVKGSSKSQFPCIYMDPNGVLKEIIVPFHFALSAQNSKQARDMHILKKLRQLMRDCRSDMGEEEKEAATQELGRLVHDLWSSEAGLQALDLLGSSKNTKPVHMHTALSALLSKYDDQDPDLMDHGAKTLHHACIQLLNLVNFFIFIEEQNSKPPTYESIVETKDVTTKELSAELLCPENEIDSLFELIKNIAAISTTTAPQTRVTFQDDDHSLFTEFLSCYDISSVTAVQKYPISLKFDAPQDKIKRISLQMFQGWLHSDSALTVWLSQAKESGIQPQSILCLALHFWLQSQHIAICASNLNLETALLRFVALMKGIFTLVDDVDKLSDYNELSSWWAESRTILANSFQPLKALTAAIVCRAVGRYLERNVEEKSLGTEKQSEDDAMEVDESTASVVSEWEHLSMDTMQWNELVRQLEDLALLDAVLQQKSRVSLNCMSHCLKWKPATVSLSSVLSKGKGSVSELVACWLASTGLDPQAICDLKEDTSTEGNLPSPQSPNKKELEMAVEATTVDPVANQILNLLDQLRQHFPYSLSGNPLLASLFWEYIQDRSQIMNNSEAANTSLEILQAIPSPHLRQGMCNLLWSLYLKQDVEKIARSMNKKSKVQVEDMGLLEGQLTNYLDFCVQFLEAFLQCNEESEIGTAEELECEELWNGPDFASSLSQVALSKPQANFGLLELHLQLLTIMHMVSFFDLKIPNVISNLFDNAGQAAFFCDLSSNPRLPSHNPGQKLTNTRTTFLCRVISGSMQTIEVLATGDTEDPERDASGPRVDATLSAQWMRKCLILASSWGVSSDKLRRHQICDLYMTGYDRLAEELIAAVSDENLLASQLLLIAGQRLKLAIKNSSDIAEKMSSLSPTISSWLQNVDVGDQFCASPLADLVQLVNHVERLLPEGHSESYLVKLLLESCHHLTSTSGDPEMELSE